MAEQDAAGEECCDTESVAAAMPTMAMREEVRTSTSETLAAGAAARATTR